MIKLAQPGFTPIPKGYHVFKIVGVEYKRDFGKMNISLQTQDGKKHIERFSLETAKGEVNEGALKAFSFFARTAMQDMSMPEIDEKALVGKYIGATVEHDVQPNKNDPTKTVTFVHLTSYQQASGFDDADGETVESDKDDLEAWLDD